MAGSDRMMIAGDTSVRGTRRPAQTEVGQFTASGRRLRLPRGWMAGGVGGALAVAALLVHMPSTFVEYGRADDYYALHEVKTFRLHEYWDTTVAGGRPVSAVAGAMSLSLVESVADLAWLRLLAVLAVAVAGGVIVSWGVLRAGGNDARRVAGPIVAGAVLVAVPGAQSVVTWAILGVPAWSLTVALLAGVIIDSWKPAIGRGLAYLVGGLLILTSAFTYQQFATLAFLPPALGGALTYARRRRVDWRPVAVAAGAVVISLIANYAFVLRFGSWLTARVNDRPALTEVATWFIEVYLPRTIDLDVPNHRTSTVIWGVVLVLLLLVPASRGLRWLSLSGGVVACWLGAALPMAFVGELWASYRVAYPPQIALWCGAVIVAGWSLSDRRHSARPIVDASGLVVASLIALALVTIGASRAYFYYAAPNGNDWRSAQCVAEDTPDLGRKGDVIVTQPYAAGRSPIVVGDEAGVISSSISWAVGDLLWLAAEETGEDPRFLPAAVPVIADTAPHARGSRYITVAQDACESTNSD